jgi:arylsulfatase A-like enzyme
LIPILAGYYPSLDLEPKEAQPGLLPRKSLATILKDQGYATAFFQTANDFEHRRQLVANLGYDVFHNLFTLPQEGFDDVGYFGKEERMMLEPSLDWVEAQSGRPFFLTYLTVSSHHPYGVPRSWPTAEFPGAGPSLARYLNAIRQTDAFLKQVLAGFEARGLIDKTLFVILGDHGEAFGEHGGYQHNQILWEEGLRTVALLHGPPVLSRGGTVEGPRSLLDVIPTVCGVLGLKLVEGRFLGESLLDPVPETRKLFFSGWTNRSSLALREGPIKTIYHFGRAPAEVYDNSKDPHDRHNLAGQGPYDAAFIKIRTDELLYWEAVVKMQYLAWEKGRRRSRP